MKKFLISLAVFIPVAALLYSVFLLVIGSKFVPTILHPNLQYRVGPNGYVYTRLAEAKTTQNVDILFLGSSRAYRGLDVRHFNKEGISSFNLGTSAQAPLQTEVLLNRYLDQMNPKMIIYDVYPINFASDGVESALEIIANDRNDWLSLQMAFEVNNAKVYNTLLFAVFQQNFGNKKTFKEKLEKDGDRYVKGGFVTKEVSYFRFEEFPKQRYDFDEEQFEIFDKMVNKIKSKGIELLLVNSPTPGRKYTSYTNNSEFDSIMQKNADYVNFNEFMPVNDSLHFYDKHHLNQTGVDIYNNKLIELLKKRGSLDAVKAGKSQ